MKKFTAPHPERTFKLARADFSAHSLGFPLAGGNTHEAHCDKFRRIAFTLAEVLITLGIIGVVAAMTLPSLISKYQKHVYYNQFLKAVSVIGSAEKMYVNDYCGGDASNCSFGIDWYENGNKVNTNFAENFSLYFKTINKFNSSNYDKVCSGYIKLPVSYHLDGSNRSGNPCSDESAGGDTDPNINYGFITADGMMINLHAYEGPYEGGYVDINGPDRGPNIFGRDIFHFMYQDYENRKSKSGIFWNVAAIMKRVIGVTLKCANTSTSNWVCGERLLQEGEMGY